jgi:MFS family permease
LFGSEKYFSLIYFAPLVFAIEKSLFWPAFHASVARFARNGQRGREFSVLYAIVNIVFIVGPFIGGFLSENFGIRMAFAAASIIYFCSFIPLFTTKEVFVPKPYRFADTLALYRQFPKKFFGYLGFGEELLVLTVWPIFIFIAVKNYEDTGVIQSEVDLQ